MSSGKTRPIGVTIISILAILVGGGLLAAGVAIAAFSSMFVGLAGVGSMLATLGAVIGGVVLFFGLIWLLTGWGLLTAKGWARTLALVFSILSLLGSILLATSGSLSAIAGCVIMVLMLYYLFTPPVKSFFGKSAGPSFSSTGGSGASFASTGAPSIPTSFSNPLSKSNYGGSSSSGSTSNTSGNTGSSSSYGGNRFCSNCGSTLSPSSNKCPSCGTTN